MPSAAIGMIGTRLETEMYLVTIGASPALVNAIVNALWRAYRIRHIDMPATPERVWAALREGERMHTL